MFIHEDTNNLVSGAFLKCFSIYFKVSAIRFQDNQKEIRIHKMKSRYL